MTWSVSRTDASVSGEQFYVPTRRCKRGHMSERYVSSGICRDCNREHAIEYRKAHPEKRQGIAWLIGQARYRAKLSKLPFNMTASDLHIPEVCPVLGIPLFYSAKRWNSPSIDRIDNDKGYVTGNVKIISYRANVLKSNATLTELRALVAYMESAQESKQL